eukprot:2015107-Amphidinium_carterae.1
MAGHSRWLPPTGKPLRKRSHTHNMASAHARCSKGSLKRQVPTCRCSRTSYGDELLCWTPARKNSRITAVCSAVTKYSSFSVEINNGERRFEIAKSPARVTSVSGCWCHILSVLGT